MDVDEVGYPAENTRHQKDKNHILHFIQIFIMIFLSLTLQSWLLRSRFVKPLFGAQRIHPAVDLNGHRQRDKERKVNTQNGGEQVGGSRVGLHRFSPFG